MKFVNFISFTALFLIGIQVLSNDLTEPALPTDLQAESEEERAVSENQFPPTSLSGSASSFPSSAGFSYDPIGKRDPFVPDKEIMATTTTTLVPVISLPSVDPTGATALQLQEAKTFQVMAIMWDTISPKAVLKDSKGQMHIVRRDIRIGTRQGYVAAIREREVVVAQPAVIEGKKSMETVILSFDKESGVK